jgi:hypothetical protein
MLSSLPVRSASNRSALSNHIPELIPASGQTSTIKCLQLSRRSPLSVHQAGIRRSPRKNAAILLDRSLYHEPKNRRMTDRFSGVALRSAPTKFTSTREERILLSQFSGASPVTNSSTALRMPNGRISPPANSRARFRYGLRSKSCCYGPKRDYGLWSRKMTTSPLDKRRLMPMCFPSGDQATADIFW